MMEYLICENSVITLAHIREARIHEPHPRLNHNVPWESSEERDKNYAFRLHATDRRHTYELYRGTLEACRAFKASYARFLCDDTPRAVNIEQIEREMPFYTEQSQ